MANFIPRIVYDPGGGDVTIDFDLPPEGDNLRERERANIRRTISTNGTTQHQFNYTEQRIAPRFVFLTQTLVDSLRTLFETHAIQGKSFKYYEHKDEVTFITVTLDRFQFQPRRVIPDGSGGFIHDIQISMRRTI